MENWQDLSVFFKQKTAYEILRSDWSSDVCSSDLSKYIEEILKWFNMETTRKCSGRMENWQDLSVFHIQ